MKKNIVSVMQRIQKDKIKFLFICPDEDQKILLKAPEEKTIEDFARLICLAMVFELKGAYFNLYSELKQIDKFDEAFDYIDLLDFETVEKWVEDFFEKANSIEIQVFLKPIWVDKKKIIQDRMKDGGFKYTYLL